MKKIILLSFVILLTSCGPVGPIVRNDIDENLNLNITYSNGKTVYLNWPKCRAVFIGTRETDKHGNPIVPIKITVKKGDQVIYNIDSNKILSLLKQSILYSENTVWEIKKDEVTFYESDTCTGT